MTMMYPPRIKEETEARDYLARMYLNTGADEEDALAFANRIFSEQGSQGCYNEAVRYEDM